MIFFPIKPGKQDYVSDSVTQVVCWHLRSLGMQRTRSRPDAAEQLLPTDDISPDQGADRFSMKPVRRCRCTRRFYHIAIAVSILALVDLVVVSMRLSHKEWCAPLRCERCLDGSPPRPPGSAPCCHDVLFDMLVDLDRFFRFEAIPYYLVWGTLLGAARDRDVIKQTADIDISVPNTEWATARNAMRRWSKQRRWGQGRGYKLFYGGLFADPQLVGVARICAVHDSSAPREFYSHYMRPESFFTFADVYSHNYQDLYWMERYGVVQKNVSNVCMRGKYFPAPCRTELFLERHYGTSWTTPDGLFEGGSKAYPANTPNRTEWFEGFPAWLEAKDRALAARGGSSSSSSSSSSSCDTKFRCK